jgi:hypothetical protein
LCKKKKNHRERKKERKGKRTSKKKEGRKGEGRLSAHVCLFVKFF